MFDPDVTPAEKWAVYTTHPVLHKVIGNLSSVVNDSLGYNDMLELIDHKHNINITTINHINTIALKNIISNEGISTCLYREIVTRLGSHICFPMLPRMTPICIRCKSSVETYDHLFQFSNAVANEARSTILQESLDTLHHSRIPQLLLNTLQYKWLVLLALPLLIFEQQQSQSNLLVYIIQAIRHQNLIGWHTML